KSTNVLQLNYSTTKLGTQKLDSLKFNYNGNASTEITPPSFKYSLKPSDWANNYKERLRLASQLNAALKQTPLGESGFLVRGRTAEQIRNSLGVRLYWWEKAALAGFGKNQKAADALAAQLAEKRINQIPSEDLRTSALNDEAKKVIQANEECFADQA